MLVLFEGLRQERNVVQITLHFYSSINEITPDWRAKHIKMESNRISGSPCGSPTPPPTLQQAAFFVQRIRLRRRRRSHLVHIHYSTIRCPPSLPQTTVAQRVNSQILWKRRRREDKIVEGGVICGAVKPQTMPQRFRGLL